MRGVESEHRSKRTKAANEKKAPGPAGAMVKGRRVGWAEGSEGGGAGGGGGCKMGRVCQRAAGQRV